MKCLQKGCEVDGPTESGHCPICGHVLVTAEGNGNGDGNGNGAAIIAGFWSEETDEDIAHFFKDDEDMSLCELLYKENVTLTDAGSDTESKVDCPECVDMLESLGA